MPDGGKPGCLEEIVRACDQVKPHLTKDPIAFMRPGRPRSYQRDVLGGELAIRDHVPPVDAVSQIVKGLGIGKIQRSQRQGKSRAIQTA